MSSIVPVAARIQNLEQKITKRTKGVMYDGNRPSLPFVRIRKDRFVRFRPTPFSLFPPVKSPKGSARWPYQPPLRRQWAPGLPLEWCVGLSPP
jgi:hypothetical protein